MELKRRHEDLVVEVQTLGQQSKKVEDQHHAEVKNLAEEIQHYKVPSVSSCTSWCRYKFRGTAVTRIQCNWGTCVIFTDDAFLSSRKVMLH